MYAAAFRSGNKTTVLHELSVSEDPARNAEAGDGFTGLGMPALPEDLPNTTGEEAPLTSIIVQHDGDAWRDVAGRDWSPRVRFNLPDKDVFAIDATQDPPVEIAHATGVGTSLFNMAVHPVTGEVYVTNIEANNLVRFEPKVKENIAPNRVTIIDFDAEGGPSVDPVHLNTHIDFAASSSNAELVAQSLSLPLQVVLTADGERVYVAAFGSYKVAVLNAAGEVLDRIDVGGGPAGLALDEMRERLYVLNRWDQTISVVDTASGVEASTVRLRYDAETPEIREGRRFLYDAAHSSAHGDASCATCHLFGNLDDLAWDLGNPQGEILVNRTQEPTVGSPNTLRAFHPMKGPMTTQSLRGLRGAGIMHWRGDRNGTVAGDTFDEKESFMEFLPAFEELMGRPEELPHEDMEKFFDFVITLRYPPNPIQSLDNVRTDEQSRGLTGFQSGGRNQNGGDGLACNRCHGGPTSTMGGSVVQNVQTQEFKIAHLRNLYTKVGMFGTARPRVVQSPFVAEETPTPHLGDQIRGFGFRHDGALPTIFDFLRELSIAHVTFPVEEDFDVAPGTLVEPFKFLDNAVGTGDQRARDLEAFLLAFPTGLAPHVGQQVTMRAGSSAERLDRFELLKQRSADLVGHGMVGGEVRGFFYEPPRTFPAPGTPGRFVSDRKGEEYSEEEMLALIATEGNVLTFTAVPRRSGERIGIDRDEDDWFDADEREHYSDPTDPESTPRAHPPQDVSAELSGSSVMLTWTPVTSNLFEVDGYEIYRSSSADELGERLNLELHTSATFVDSAAPRGSSFYRVRAYANEQSGITSSVVEVLVTGTPFRRGDCNLDDFVNISDPINALNVLFTGEGEIGCDDACDANDDGAVNIADAIALFGVLFSGQGVIPPPGTEQCGLDPSSDPLGCNQLSNSCR